MPFGLSWGGGWPFLTRRVWGEPNSASTLQDIYASDWLCPSPVERDRPVSPFYFGVGQPIVPPVAEERYNRLSMFKALYEGHASALGLLPSEYAVFINYFSRFSNLVKFLLMAIPPDYQNLNEEAVSAGYVNRILSEVIIDMTRYGTGLFWVNDSVIEAADPRYWFPSGIKNDTTWISVKPMESADGQTTSGADLTVWWQRDVMNVPVHSYAPYWSDDGQNISGGGPIMNANGELMPPLPGRVLFPVALSPIEGGFGPSVYQDMLSVVAELTRRQSSISHILDENADPILGAKARQQDGVPMPGQIGPGDDATARQRLRQVTFGSATGRRRSAYVLPQWAESVEYVTWDGSLTAAFTQMERMLTALASVTSVPESLYGILASGEQPSGVSLKRQHVGAWLYLETLQKLLIPVLVDVIEAAGGGQVEIVWLNPIDQLDGSDAATMSLFAGEEREMRTGKNLSEGDSDEVEDDDSPDEMG